MSETGSNLWCNPEKTPTEVQHKPDVSGIARRSISIFSRKGTETPEAKSASLSTALTSNSPTKKMSERQQTWLWRKSLDARKRLEFHPRGTVLNAVPPAEETRMTRLEREMATSPNEEIMSAISERPSVQTAWNAAADQPMPSYQQSPSHVLHPFVGLHPETMQRTDSAKRRETNTRIGVWVDGVIHWDEDLVQDRAGKPTQMLRSSDTEAAQTASQGITPGWGLRPNLTVSIPQRRAANIGHPPILQQDFHIAPANTVEKFEHEPPRVIVDDITPNEPSHAASKETTNSHDAINHGLKADNRRTSSSTASPSVYSTAMSDYSKRSSTTSIDPTQTAAPCSDQEIPLPSGINVHKPLPRAPVPRNMRPAPAPPSSPVSKQRRHSEQITRSAPGSKKNDRFSLGHTSIGRTHGVQSLLNLDMIDAEFIRASPYAYAPSLSDETLSEAESPTLSQAEHDLRTQLGTINEVLNKDDNAASVTQLNENAAAESDALHSLTATDATHAESSIVHRSDSVHSVMRPPARAPTVPKRSRKRDWRNNTHVDNTGSQAVRPPPKAPGRRKSESTLSYLSVVHHSAGNSITEVHRSESERIPLGVRSRHGRGSVCMQSPDITLSVPTSSQPMITTQYDDHAPVATGDLPAEQVLIRILSAFSSVRDLFNMAMINKGMYRVFKENELYLLKTVTGNVSSAASELREWRTPANEDDLELPGQKPSSADGDVRHFHRLQLDDEDAVKQLKKLILQNCQSFMRRETALAFAHPHHPIAQRFTDAFWRVWTFCIIFGSRKGREEDITGQLDWLKGGAEANNQSFSATVNTNLDFDIGSVLLNAPEHFAQGNQGGLSATQLYDMTELWNCLGALLTGYQGKVEEARRYGIYANCDVAEGDIELEEHMLEEWLAFVLTLGPDVVLKLALHAKQDASAGFELAKVNGWTKWAPSVTTSRATFLREPAARLYEERISTAAAQMQNPHDLEKKETARKRVAALAQEIRLRRQTSGYKRLPLIDMHSERAMSMVSRHPSAVAIQQPVHPIRTSLPPSTRYNGSQSARPVVANAIPEGIVSPMSHASSAASARPSSPMSLWSSRHISPIIEDRVEAFNRLSLANLDGVADSTVERAVRKITEMGFTEAQATHALKFTDMGDGLRVDRAVDMLLRN